MTLMDVCRALLEVQSQLEYAKVLTRATNMMSCETFGGFHIGSTNSVSEKNPLLTQFTNVSPDYTAYFDSVAAKDDPVMQYVKASSLPKIWNQSTYVNAQQGEMWEDMAEFGMLSGIVLGMHLPNHQHFCFGIETSAQWGENDKQAGDTMRDFCLVAIHAHATAARLFEPLQAALVNPLSPREREILVWAAAGKTGWETARILSIAESTVSKHVDSIVKRLECVSKTHAVATAMRAGWL